VNGESRLFLLLLGCSLMWIGIAADVESWSVGHLASAIGWSIITAIPLAWVGNRLLVALWDLREKPKTTIAAKSIEVS